MRLCINRKILICTIGFLFVFSSLLKGQTFSFVNYGTDKNSINGFVYTIVQSNDGFLWVGTANGLSRFDGYNFFPAQYPDSASGRYPTKSIKDKNGVLWFGCSDGTVWYAKGNKLIPVPISNTKSISELIEGTDGLIYVIPQAKAIYSINPLKPEEIHQYSISVDQVLFSGSFTNTGKLLIGTQENLLICKLEKDSVAIIKVINGFDSYGVTSIHSTGDKSRFVIGTDGNGLFQLKVSDKGEELIRFPDSEQFNSLKVQSITEDSEKSFWISTTGAGVVQFELSENFEKMKSVKLYDVNSGLNGNNVKTVYQDFEGNYWFGLFGEGVSMLTSYAIAYYSPGKSSQENNILVIKNFDNNFILGTPTGFHLFNAVAGKSISFTDLSNQVGHAEIKCYYLDKENNLWIGTNENGLFVRSNKGTVREFYKSGDTGADDIKDIQMDNKNIWLATTNGVIVLDKAGNTRKKFDINNGLPHNSINKILLTDDGSAYIGTESDKLYKIDSDFHITIGNAVMSGSTRNRILSFSHANDGAIWVATEGNGIFKFLGDSVSVISRSNDLMSNFCYSILSDADNEIWVGHNKGFSKFNSATGTVRILGSDFAKIGICNAEGMFESADRKIFIGTTEGLIIYDKMKERKNEIAPFNNINTIEINDVAYPYQPSFVIPYMKYKVKIHYSGINFSSPDKVY